MVIQRAACECVDRIKYVGHDTIYWYYYNLRIPHIIADQSVRVCVCLCVLVRVVNVYTYIHAE